MKNKKFLLAIILLITFVTHASYIFNGFIWLDHNDIELKRAILPISEIGSVFFRPFGATSFYRPLVTIVNSIDYFFYHDWAPGFHLTNILLHIIVVAITPLFLSLFFNISYPYLILAALIVAVHPASIMVVGWIIQRQELLLLIFTMLTIIFYIKAQQNTAIKYKLLTFLSFLAALFSKETALFVIPILILLHHLSSRGKSRDLPIYLRKLPLKLWFGLSTTGIIYLILRFTAVPNLWNTQFTPLPIEQAIGTRLSLITKWVLILISPLKPNFSDAVAVTGLLSPQALISLGLLIISFIIIIKYKFSSNLAKSILLLFILLAPGLNIIPVPRIGSAHYAYLPSIAIAALVVSIISALNNNLYQLPLTPSLSKRGNSSPFIKGRSGGVGVILLLLWITIASISTFTSGFQFKNDLTLFTPEITRDPDFVEGYYYLGNYYLKERNLEQAAFNYELGLIERPKILSFGARRWIIMNLAGVRFQQNRLNESERLYSEALVDAEDTLKPFILFNQALAAFKMENYRKVIELLRDLNWDRPEAYLLLAKSYRELGMSEEEVSTLKRALPFLSEAEKEEIETVIKEFESRL